MRIWFCSQCFCSQSVSAGNNADTSPPILSKTLRIITNLYSIVLFFSEQRGCRFLWLHHHPSIREQDQLSHSNTRWETHAPSNCTALFFFRFLQSMFVNVCTHAEESQKANVLGLVMQSNALVHSAQQEKPGWLCAHIHTRHVTHTCTHALDLVAKEF